MVPLDIEGEHSLTVTEDIVINFLGVPEGRVLGTPFLIWNLEMASRNLIKPLLEAGFDSVGTVVHVKHLAATPLGMKVTFRTRVIVVEARRVQFAVEAFDQRDKIAEGTHERGIIQIAKFAVRVSAKRQPGPAE